MTFSELAVLLNASPKSYNDLTAQQKLDVRDLLAPLSGFNAPQKAWFGDWWMACTQVQVDNMNAALPVGVRIKAVSYLGLLYINIDVVTDCMGATDTYFGARPILRTLICTNIPGLADLLPKTQI